MSLESDTVVERLRAVCIVLPEMTKPITQMNADTNADDGAVD